MNRLRRPDGIRNWNCREVALKVLNDDNRNFLDAKHLQGIKPVLPFNDVPCIVNDKALNERTFLRQFVGKCLDAVLVANLVADATI